jgi:hypothetical protein
MRSNGLSSLTNKKLTTLDLQNFTCFIYLIFNYLSYSSPRFTEEASKKLPPILAYPRILSKLSDFTP